MSKPLILSRPTCWIVLICALLLFCFSITLPVTPFTAVSMLAQLGVAALQVFWLTR